MKYKLSKYNIEYIEKNSTIMFNTLTGEFTKFPFEVDINFVLNMEEEKYKYLFEFLKNKRYIIEENEDEEKLVKQLENRIKKNNNQLSIVIMTTEKCNFRCEYCYEEKKKERLDSSKMEDIVQFVKQRISNYEGLYIEWFGGEPMLEMGVIEELSKKFIGICKDVKIPYRAGITTNGFFLSIDAVKQLKKLKISNYQITLDGMRETHDKQRKQANGKGSWETIVNNLREIRDNLNSSTLKFVIRTNITKEIFDDFDTYLNFIKKEFLTDKRFSFLFRMASDWGGEIGVDVKNKFIEKKDYQNIIRKLLEEQIPLEYFKSVLKPGGLLCYAWKEGSYVFNSEGKRIRCTLKIEDYQVEDEYRRQEYKKYGHPEKCLRCVKYPICLKVNCCLSETYDSKMICDYDVEMLEEILPLLATSYYNCKVYEIKMEGAN